MPAVYSHSGLASFEKCPRQYWFRYVRKLEVDTESVEAFLGKRVHEILERLYQFVAAGRLPRLAQVLERFVATWNERLDPARVRIVRSDVGYEFYRDTGLRCLSGYYRRRYPFDEEETLGLEEMVHFSLDEDGRYRMRGVVDRIARARDGVLEIHDYKTGRRVPSQQDADRDRQLALYQLGLARRFGRTPVRLVWHYLASGLVRVSTRDPEQLLTLRRDTMAVIDRVESETEFAPKPSALCAWCEYREHCPAFGAADEPPRAAADRAAPAAPTAAAARAARAAPPAAAARAVPPARPAGEQVPLFRS